MYKELILFIINIVLILMNNSNDFIGTASAMCYSKIIINTNTDYFQITEKIMVLLETLSLKVYLEVVVWQRLVGLSNAEVLQPLVMHIVFLLISLFFNIFKISN